MSSLSVSDAQAYCTALTKKSGSNFYYSFLFLPKQRRAALYTVYAFCKEGQRRKFKTPWREPKALIIFVFDKQGKMIRRDRRPLIDGTLLGPDHLAELVAWHLHRLGAAKAEVVVFVSDGALLDLGPSG